MSSLKATLRISLTPSLWKAFSQIGPLVILLAMSLIFRESFPVFLLFGLEELATLQPM